MTEAVPPQDRTPSAEALAAALNVPLPYYRPRNDDDDRVLACALDEFAAAVSAKAVKAERERCAQQCETMAQGMENRARGSIGSMFSAQSATDLRRAAERIRALTDDTAPQAGWQSIETAPKGKILLLFAVTDRKEDGSITNWKMATGSTPFEGPVEWTWDGYRLREWDVQPTHWMPLPAAPQAARDETKE